VNGFKVFNWAKKYKTIHIDKCRKNKKVDIMMYNHNTDMTAKIFSLLDCPPSQDWDKILNNEIEPNYFTPKKIKKNLKIHILLNILFIIYFLYMKYYLLYSVVLTERQY